MRDVIRMVADAQAAYIRCIDSDRLEDWPAFFHEPCLYKVTSADNHREGLEAGLIFANTLGMLKDRVSALREANIYERQAYRHILGHPFLLSQNGDEAHTETPLPRRAHHARRDHRAVRERPLPRPLRDRSRHS